MILNNQNSLSLEVLLIYYICLHQRNKKTENSTIFSAIKEKPINNKENELIKE